MDELVHYGVKGMKWGVRKDRPTSPRKPSAKIANRERSYKIRKFLNNPNETASLISQYGVDSAAHSGVLSTNKRVLKAIETMGIQKHSEAVYNNLSRQDVDRLKTYTDSAQFSRKINGYLAIGEPPEVAAEANKLKETLSKNTVDNMTVYRSCNLKFSTDGLAKKLENATPEELSEMFGDLSKNFSGKTRSETRVFSTSTSPLFAIDTWRKVNPKAAATYNTYMIINCKKCPGILADGKLQNGGSLVNTRSNQEAILAPETLTYRKLAFDQERGMFAITVDATGSKKGG